jgi:hypothetical protein
MFEVYAVYGMSYVFMLIAILIVGGMVGYAIKSLFSKKKVEVEQKSGCGGNCKCKND